MHDESQNKVSNWRAVAIKQVDDYIAGLPKAGRLPPHITKGYHKGKFSPGWRVPVAFSKGVCHELHILADGEFPYTPPRIAIADGPDVLAWPHLEDDGLLCILPSDTAVSSQNPAIVTEYILGEACRLIEESISGSNVADFRFEFLSYWERTVDQDATNFISILEPQGPSREITVWHSNKVYIVGEKPEALEQWLPRWGAEPGKNRKYKFYKGVLLWLPEPLLPNEYPHTAADVRTLARERSSVAEDVLAKLAASNAESIDVLLGTSTANGACFGAITIRPPHLRAMRRGKRNTLEDGFRPGHVPQALSINRYLSRGAKVTKATVERADHSWIHGRDQDPLQERLRRVRVAILGCGSLGGGLAKLLAQAGIGNLLLVDPAILEWPNVGRHALGADSVDFFKAKRLEQEIIKAYPHLGDISSLCERVGPKAQSLMDKVTSCDLIVSTMGNWAAENFLNDFQQEQEYFPTILYGWLEPNAAAAHAVLIPQDKACLRCGVNDRGSPHLTVTSWDNGYDMLQEPACGALFTPYGPIELCSAQTLLAKSVIDALTDEGNSAIHRVWIGYRNHIEATGGAWSEKWIAEMGDPGFGGLTLERMWSTSSTCPVCIHKVRAA